MIQIIRGDLPPVVKFVNRPNAGREKWVVRTEEVITDFNADPASFFSGEYDLEKDFGNKIFRTRLKELHHDKCCFCEKKIDSGDIEHFRPKKAIIINEISGGFIRPGYYWLAYDWNNMIFSCKECNSIYKGNLFPLLNDETNRVTHHQANLDNEDPIFIDPVLEDPESFISFNNELAVAIDDNQRAIRTIDIMGLNSRPVLVGDRKERLDRYMTNYKMANLPIELIGEEDHDEAVAFVNKAQNSDEKFAGTIRANLRGGQILVFTPLEEHIHH